MADRRLEKKLEKLNKALVKKRCCNPIGVRYRKRICRGCEYLQLNRIEKVKVYRRIRKGHCKLYLTYLLRKCYGKAIAKMFKQKCDMFNSFPKQKGECKGKGYKFYINYQS